ncbi:MAG: RNA polymerase-binding protein RbpA, partial [Nocardioidaceae bacterium]
RGHESRPSFAVDAVIPEEWDCPRCGLPGGPDKDNPPAPPKVEPYKTHLAYVKERRSDKEAEDILDEAIQTLRARRKRGEIIF